MKIKFDKDNLLIYVNNASLRSKEEIEDYIKNIIYSLRQKQKQKISGFYNVDIFQNDCYGLIIAMNKQDNLDFFPDLIDLNIDIHFNETIYLKIEDYFLIKNIKNIYYYNNNYYIDIKNVNSKDLLFLSEFFEVIYGDTLKQIKSKFILVEKPFIA